MVPLFFSNSSKVPRPTIAQWRSEMRITMDRERLIIVDSRLNGIALASPGYYFSGETYRDNEKE